MLVCLYKLSPLLQASSSSLTICTALSIATALFGLLLRNPTMASPPAALPPAAMKQLKAMQGKHSRLQEKLDADYKKKLTDLDTKIEKAEQGLQSLFKQRKDTMERHKNDKAKLLKEQQAESANVSHSQQSAVESRQPPLAGQVCALKYIFNALYKLITF
jgi:septal ring factor EnvC (AmiA/AmiB activator)